MLDTPEVLRRPVQWRSSRGTVLWIRVREASRVQLMPGLGWGDPSRARILSSEKWKTVGKF